MAINKKLIHFNNKTAFDKELKAGNILDKSIVFIKDSQEIYTHGQLYSCKEFDEDTFNYISEQIQKLEPLLEESEYEAVDLGLPSGTLWANKNIGAENPEDAGLYFQWGDTQGWRADQIGTGEGQKAFTWADYKFSEPGATNSNPQLTKYCDKAEYGKNGFTDNKVTLDLEDNAAYINMDSCWRIPTEKQLSELLKLEYKWVYAPIINEAISSERKYLNLPVYEGIKYDDQGNVDLTQSTQILLGISFIGNNDNKLFIPYSGQCENGRINNCNQESQLWLSSLFVGNPTSSASVKFSNRPYYGQYTSIPYTTRHKGFTIRAVTTNPYNYHTRKEIDELIATIESKIAAIESKVSNIENTSFTNAEYDQTSKELVFYTKKGDETRIDATPFIVDNFVDSVAINGNNLVITFNSESKAPISIPITSIFNPDQYYTKTEVDNKIPTDYVSKSGLDVRPSVIPLSKNSSDTVGVALSHYNHTFTNNQKNTDINVCYTEIVNTSDNSHLLKTNMDVYDGTRELESDSNNVVLEKGLKHTIDNININLENKADVDNLPNVISEEVIDSDTFEDFNTVTREELKKDLFIDQWDAAWKVSGTVYGKYDPENAPDAEHPFMGNDVWMTYEEAILVWELSIHEPLMSLAGAFTNAPCRTFLPILSRDLKERGAISLKGLCSHNETVEVLNMGSIKASDLFDAFVFAKNLKKVLGVIDVSEITNTRGFWYFTDQAIVLSEISLKGLKVSMSMGHNPLLSLASLQYLIANAANTATITVTVHKDVYAKLTGDTTNAAAAALTEEELAQWQALVTTAAAKSISFATV